MDVIIKYKISTLIYSLCFLFGIFMSIVAIIQEKWLVFIIALAFAYVSLDNTFCGAHARTCGYKVKGHYVVPPFLKKK